MIDGLKAEEYSEWIDKKIEIDEDLKAILREFLIGSPAYGVSRKGRNLFDFYHYTGVDEYSALYMELVGSITDISYSITYEKLKEELLRHRWLGFKELPSEVSEAIYIYDGENKDDKLFMDYFIDVIQVENKSTKESRSQAIEEKRRVLHLNQIFRHIRNSLAHGSFAEKEYADECYMIFQDENPGHMISARMILRKATVDKWRTVLRKKEERRKELDIMPALRNEILPIEGCTHTDTERTP